jgi:DNA-binding NtrC family response regulator
MPDATVLILDDDADVGTAARLLLRQSVGAVRVLQQPGDLAAALDADKPAVLLLDMNFAPGQTDGEQGLALLRQTVARADAPAVVTMTAYAEVDLAVRALKLGAFDFVTKPWNNARLVATVQAAIASRRAGSAPIAKTSSLIGESAPMRSLRRLIASVAPTEANVLILGEMGVGKELVARELHQQSLRAARAFLPVDLGALPESMFESELFGHRRGSFTDARSDRAGRFQAANGGTLFLDEVGNLPLVQQGKLLTVLERREVTPLGADRAEPVDVRVVSATNLDERRLFDPSCFRADLLYRLNTVVLRVPPLRERREDILAIAGHYLAQYAAQYAKPERPLSAAAAQALQDDAWHGNVRALRHACERAIILGGPSQLEAADFQLGAAATASIPTPAPLPQADAGAAASMRLEDVERSALVEAMRAAKGNLSEAARRLGVSRAALYRRLEKHGL